MTHSTLHLPASSPLYTVKRSPSFMQRWQELLYATYKYDSYMDFVVVSSFMGAKTFCYYPFLDYSDRHMDEIDDLLDLGEGLNYQIRCLDPHYADFQTNDPVIMRLDTSGQDSEAVFAKQVHTNCRRKTRQSIKRNSWEIQRGTKEQLINDFYRIFQAVMHQHGTPVNTIDLFQNLPRFFGDDVIFQITYNGQIAIAASILLRDGPLVTLYWNVIDYRYSDKMVGYFSFWQAIELAISWGGVDIFDFGRSAYNGTTYRFKTQWGAQPIKVAIIKNRQEDIYSKYELASNIWAKLPSWMVNRLGPVVCRHLPDL